MAREEHVAILKQGVDVWNQWRAENPELQPDLSRVNFWNLEPGDPYLMEALWNVWFPDPMAYSLKNVNFDSTNLRGVCLSSADLRGARFKQADLSFADLRHATVDQADFTNATLKAVKLNGLQASRANLSGADLENSDLSEAHLNEANLAKAYLKGVNFTGANLYGTDLTQAVMQWSLFVNVDLCNVRGLEAVRHYGPSSIGMDTIHRSEGRIPDAFLRGCGLSALEIEYAKLADPGLGTEQTAAITDRIRQFYRDGRQAYSCFISFDRGDEELTRVLYSDLQRHGIRCWFVPEHQTFGDPLRPGLDRQIRLRTKLLVVLSENSAKNEWVGDEVESALQEEVRSNRLILVPIRLDDAVMNTQEEWVANVRRSRHIEDFTNWRNRNHYQQVFQQLLRKLRIAGGA